MMPELGFSPEYSEQLVSSFNSGWQMRMSLGKILLQEPDLLLLDEPTNHLDLDTIEWLKGYLNKQDVPIVIISHDRAFLDQLCTKIVETDMGVSRTYEGNYSKYVLAKAAWIEAQNAAWEKQQKQIEHTKDIISRLGAGANVGCASSAEKVRTLVQKSFKAALDENDILISPAAPSVAYKIGEKTNDPLAMYAGDIMTDVGLLVGNKCDMTANKVVSYETGKQNAISLPTLITHQLETPAPLIKLQLT